MVSFSKKEVLEMRKSFAYQLVMLMFLLAFSLVIGQESHSAQVENLIRNGDFEDGCWTGNCARAKAPVL